MMEFSGFGNDFGEAVGDAIQETALQSFGKSTAEHFEDVLSSGKRTEKAGQVGSG